MVLLHFDKHLYCHIFTNLITRHFAIHLYYVVFHVQCFFILNTLYIKTEKQVYCIIQLQQN